MKIKRYEPELERLWEHRTDGSFRAWIYTSLGLVEFFTFPGDERYRAFTNLQMYIAPNVYASAIPRHYHDRWARRLARQFAERCHADAKALKA
jgi:hypothetical protein